VLQHNNRFMALSPGLLGIRRNIHPLTPILIINRPLSAYSLYYDPQHPPCSIYMLDSLFAQPLSKSSFVCLLFWNPPLHTPCISSPNHLVINAARYGFLRRMLWLCIVVKTCRSNTSFMNMLLSVSVLTMIHAQLLLMKMLA